MSKSFSLQPLLEIMQNRTDEATRHLGRLIAAEQNARSRLEMLEQYRSEYADRLRENIAQGITRQALGNYQDFLARIDEAISQQSRAVSQSEANTVLGQQHWREQHTKMKAIDTLSIRHQERQRKQEDKQEQKLLDEYSTRKFGRPAEDS